MTNERVMRFPAGSNFDDVMGVLEGTHKICECFTHIDDENRLTRKFNVTLINEYCLEHRLQIFIGELNKEGYEICKNQRGYEQRRLDRITQRIIDTIPVIFIAEDDGTHLMIDGTHRYIKAWEMGIREIKCYIIDKKVWNQFLLPVDDITPEELLKKDSGL